MTSLPGLSVVVVCYNMSVQIARTLHSLSPAYQQGIDPNAYEVVVVENISDDMLGEEKACSFGPQFRYFANDEKGISPAGAVNLGVSKARFNRLGIMMDGARMVTPGLLQFAQASFKLSDQAVVSVPNYTLGEETRVFAEDAALNKAEDEKLLKQIGWPADGYLLFRVGWLNKACNRGLFIFFTESNCLFCSREFYEKTGGCDERFNLAGGGMLNLDLYRKLVSLPEAELFMLPGEGSFHQFHGGATTGPMNEDRVARIKGFVRQHEELYGENYQPVRKRPILLGRIPIHLAATLEWSGRKLHVAYQRRMKDGTLDLL